MANTGEVMAAEGRRVTSRQRAAGLVVTGAVLLAGGYALHQQKKQDRAAGTSQVDRLTAQAEAALPEAAEIVAGGTTTKVADPELSSFRSSLPAGSYRVDVVCIGNGTIEVDVTIGATGKASLLRCKKLPIAQSAELTVGDPASGLVVERGATAGDVVAWQVARI